MVAAAGSVTAGRSAGQQTSKRAARSKLRLHWPTLTAVVWEWQAGPVGASIDFGRQPGDCVCLLRSMRELAVCVLEGHIDPSTIAYKVEMVEDGIRLAVGPGRVVFLELTAPERPEFLS